jgi:sarcosine oxidase subunit alpha
VVAAGRIERPYVFEGNDKPGVMLSTAVRKMIALYAVKPGQRAVIFSANDSGDAAAEDLRRVGVEIAAVVDARRGEKILRATGRGRVQTVELGDGRSLSADLLVTAVGWTTPTSLLNMAGDLPTYNPHAARFLSDANSLPDNVMATGEILGDGRTDEILAQAQAVGREAARRSQRRKAKMRRINPR